MRCGTRVRLTLKSEPQVAGQGHRSRGWAPCPFFLPQPGVPEALCSGLSPGPAMLPIVPRVTGDLVGGLGHCLLGGAHYERHTIGPRSLYKDIKYRAAASRKSSGGQGHRWTQRHGPGAGRRSTVSWPGPSPRPHSW